MLTFSDCNPGLFLPESDDIFVCSTDSLILDLTEDSIAVSSKPPMCIYVNFDTGRSGPGIEYFKVYDRIEYSSKNANVARIRFREAIYENHGSEKKRFVLNSKERKILVNLLNSKATEINSDIKKAMRKQKIDSITNWEKAILIHNNILGLTDYNKSFENKVDNLIHPKFMPINLEMPDYTKLRERK